MSQLTTCAVGKVPAVEGIAGWACTSGGTTDVDADPVATEAVGSSSSSTSTDVVLGDESILQSHSAEHHKHDALLDGNTLTHA